MQELGDQTEILCQDIVGSPPSVRSEMEQEAEVPIIHRRSPHSHAGHFGHVLMRPLMRAGFSRVSTGLVYNGRN